MKIKITAGSGAAGLGVIGTGLALALPDAKWIGWTLVGLGLAILVFDVRIERGHVAIGSPQSLRERLKRVWPQYLMIGSAVLFFVGLVGFLQINVTPPEKIIVSVSDEVAMPTKPMFEGQGGKGGSGEIFGNNGTIIGGKGGNVGPGGVGRGGDGGGGVIHGDGGTIIGGEGGSIDGTNIWFPPAQSGYIQHMESQGQTPDFGVQYPGAGGATGGWLQRQQIVAKIREEYFKNAGQEAKIQSSKLEDVPLGYINERLKEAGYSWCARIEKKYWYLYYIP